MVYSERFYCYLICKEAANLVLILSLYSKPILNKTEQPMLRSVLTFLIVVIALNYTYSQHYSFPFIGWKQTTQFSQGDYTGNFTTTIGESTIDIDTIINGINYYRQVNEFGSRYIRQEDGRLYVLANELITEALLMDFSLSVGDLFIREVIAVPGGTISDTLFVQSKVKLLGPGQDSIYQLVLAKDLSMPFGGTTWIEGVGDHISGLNFGGAINEMSSSIQLCTINEKNQTIYSSEILDCGCEELFGFDKDRDGLRNQIGSNVTHRVTGNLFGTNQNITISACDTLIIIDETNSPIDVTKQGETILPDSTSNEIFKTLYYYNLASDSDVLIWSYDTTEIHFTISTEDCFFSNDCSQNDSDDNNANIDALFDCPGIMADIGDACDDQNPQTVDDLVTSDCICEGQQIFDCPSLMLNVGDPCDDGDPMTDDDTIDNNCICNGSYIFPPSSCPNNINDIFCEQWLQDSISSLQQYCDNSQGWVIVELLERDSIDYIHIGLCFAADGCEGSVYTCSGETVGTSIVEFFGIRYDPEELVDFDITFVGDCITGYPACSSNDNDDDGFTASEDCDDSNESVYPGAEEICNNMDDNCDGRIDEGFAITRYYFDGDGDGYGVPSPSILSCSNPMGYAITFDDCNDTNPFINPGQTEGPYNGLDDDCNSATPDDDLDGDGYSLQEDCDDLDSNINPAAQEICDNLDNNCNDEIDEGLPIKVGYLDSDGDGYGSSTDSIQDCAIMNGYVDNNMDCNDSDSDVNPSVSEIIYNGLDDDCNALTLDDDLDGDGFSIVDDCNDNNADINPNADEIPNNGVDEDCDGGDLLSSIHKIAGTTIRIYPNPVSDVIYIEVEGPLEYELKLYSTEGKLLLESQDSNQINIETLSSGTYLFEILDQASNKRIVQRVVVAR